MKTPFKTYPHYKELQKLLQKPENKHCADCNSENPSWLSINIGVFICINCSSIHRQLGTNISKIKSISLDVISIDIINALKGVNNELINKYWEGNLTKDKGKKEWNELVKFIKEKYEEKKYVIDKEKEDPFTEMLHKVKTEEGRILRMNSYCVGERKEGIGRDVRTFSIGNDNKGNGNGDMFFNFNKFQIQDNNQGNDPFNMFFGGNK